jgi:hypothetical protein
MEYCFKYILQKNVLALGEKREKKEKKKKKIVQQILK